MYLQACLGRMDKIQVKNGAGGGGGVGSTLKQANKRPT